MRTAEEYYNLMMENVTFDTDIKSVKDWYKKVINEAIKETVEECAEICKEHRDSGCFDGEGAEANILNLISQLK